MVQLRLCYIDLLRCSQKHVVCLSKLFYLIQWYTNLLRIREKKSRGGKNKLCAVFDFRESSKHQEEYVLYLSTRQCKHLSCNNSIQQNLYKARITDLPISPLFYSQFHPKRQSNGMTRSAEWEDQKERKKTPIWYKVTVSLKPSDKNELGQEPDLLWTLTDWILAVERRFVYLTHLLVLLLHSLVLTSYARNVLVFNPLIEKNIGLTVENLFKSDLSDPTVVCTKPWGRATATLLLISKPSCSNVRNVVSVLLLQGYEMPTQIILSTSIL
jgi:hypothetical protein